MDDTRTEEEDRAQGVFVRKLVAAVVAVVVAAFGASWAARTGWEIAGRKPAQKLRIVGWDTEVPIPEGAHWQTVERNSGTPLLVIVSDE